MQYCRLVFYAGFVLERIGATQVFFVLRGRSAPLEGIFQECGDFIPNAKKKR